MRETGRSGIAAYLRACVLEKGGLTRKVVFTGHRGSPDYLVWLPRWDFPCLVETKRPKKKPEPRQTREHVKLRRTGIKVLVVSTKEEVDFLCAAGQADLLFFSAKDGLFKRPFYRKRLSTVAA